MKNLEDSPEVQEQSQDDSTNSEEFFDSYNFDVHSNETSSNDDDLEEEQEANGQENEQVQNRPRKSSRSNFGKPPQYFGDFARLANDLKDEPRTYTEAMNSVEKHQWKMAMFAEFESLKENETWSLVKLPDDRKAIGSKWVFKIKMNLLDGSRTFKARLVAQGFSQKYGLDYDEGFAPVVKQVTFRLMITIASKRRYLMENFDVKTAFLYGNLE